MTRGAARGEELFHRAAGVLRGATVTGARASACPGGASTTATTSASAGGSREGTITSNQQQRQRESEASHGSGSFSRRDVPRLVTSVRLHHQSPRRDAFFAEFIFFPSSLRRFEPRVGFVAMRFSGTYDHFTNSARSRSSA